MTSLQITTCEDVFSGPARFLPSPLGAVCAGVGGGGEEGVCCTYKQVEKDQDNNDNNARAPENGCPHLKVLSIRLNSKYHQKALSVRISLLAGT